MKICLGCGINKPLDDYYFKNKAKKLYRSRCKKCYLEQNSLTMGSSAEANKRYRQNNPDAARNSELKTKFNITLNQYNERLIEQAGVCKICGEVNQGGKRLAVDHDHSCCPGVKSCGNCIRGLLCDRCNTTLGKFNDSPELIRKLADYLEKDESFDNGVS